MDSASLVVDAAGPHDVAAGNGQLVTVRGHKFVFHAGAPGGGDVALEVHYSNTVAHSSPTIPELNTTFAVPGGESVVLAEAPPPEAAAHAADATLMNLLVARVDNAAPVAP